jgi:DNA-binding beta-propeller fold protein YncE
MWGSERDNEGRGPQGGSTPARADSRPPTQHQSVSRVARTGHRALTRRVAAGLCLVLGGLALWSSAPALALIHRGHTFSFAIEGEKTEKLSKPSGVAVNESTEDVYVVDAGNNRIERFSATGTFIAAWGWGVSDAKEEYEVCTSACKAGLAGTGLAQFNSPEAIAVDNTTGPSGGDVYVVSDRLSVPNVIEKFSSIGESLGRVSTPEVFSIGGLAVDAHGVLWLWEHEAGVIDSFTGAVKNEPRSRIQVEEGELFGPGISCGAPGFAVDAGGEALYVNHQREDFEEECPPEGAPSAIHPAVVGKVHVAGEPPLGQALIQALDVENSSAVAVDLSTGEPASGDVYVDNVTNIAAFTSAGSLIQRFGAEAGLTKGRGVAVDPQRGKVIVADANRVAVFGPTPAGPPMIDSVSSQNIDPTSTRLEARIDANGIDTHYYFQYGTVDCKVSPSSCTDVPLPAPGADIGSGFGDVAVSHTLPGLQSGTTYFYRVVAENEEGAQAEGAQSLSSFTTLPNPVGLLPDGRAWELVSPPDKGGSGIEAIGGSGGPAGGIMEAAEGGTFNADGSSKQGNAITYVADGPIEPKPEGSRSPEGTQVVSTRGSEGWSSQGIVTPHNQGEGLPAGKPQEYQLFSADLAFALVQPWGVTNLQEPALAGSEPEERGIYRRSNATCQATPATCYLPLVTRGANRNDLSEEAFGGQLGIIAGGGVISGTSDLSHVVFQSEVALTGPKAKKPVPAPRLYEWSQASAPSEQLALVSVLPNGKLAARPVLGNNVFPATNARDAISSDGSRVFWSETEEGANEETSTLYVRDTIKGETLKLNTPEAGVKLSKAESEEGEEVHFQLASADGSRVFFTDTVSLTTASRLSTTKQGPADLYECALVEVAEKLTCKLTDLTVDPRSALGETADVVGIPLGLGESTNGSSSIYVVANGVLSEDARAHGATTGNCARPNSQTESPEAECNLYVKHYNGETKAWEEPQLIARLSQEDGPDWGGSGTGSLGGLTSRVSPNGDFLAFMSNRSLTGYNNVEANPEAKGARDEEVFLYDRVHRRLVCASCNPNPAEQPHGVLDTERSGEGLGLLVDRPGVWRSSQGGRWLAGSVPGWTPLEPNSAPYQSRYLSDSGRLFFNGADALVSQDTNAKEDVYQYEPAGLGSCEQAAGCVALLSSGTAKNESAFLDASASGDDVFFVSAGQLAATDHDNSFDVYDARVCTEESPCVKPPPPPPPPCGNEETCRPPGPAPQTFAPPPSATFSGPGNIAKQETLAVTEKSKPPPLTKAQKLAKALTTCRKKFKHAKKKRAACEKKARKTYGAKKTAKHKHKTGTKK